MQAARIDDGVVQHTRTPAVRPAALPVRGDNDNSGSIRDIVLVGTDSHAIGLANTFQRNPKLGCRVIGLVGPDLDEARGQVQLLGPIADLDKILEREQADGVVMSRSSLDDHTVNVLTTRLTDAGYHVALSALLHANDAIHPRPQPANHRKVRPFGSVTLAGWRVLTGRWASSATSSRP